MSMLLRSQHDPLVDDPLVHARVRSKNGNRLTNMADKERFLFSLFSTSSVAAVTTYLTTATFTTALVSPCLNAQNDFFGDGAGGFLTTACAGRRRKRAAEMFAPSAVEQ